MNHFSVLDLNSIETFLKEDLREYQHMIFLSIIILLICDLFLSIPTIPTSIIAGYLLGPFYGTLAISIGLLISSSLGYFFGHIMGEKILGFVLKESEQRKSFERDFERLGEILILFSRSVRMIPEIMSILSGMNRMSFRRYLFLVSLNSIPYAIVLSYIGAKSSLTEPFKILPLLFFVYLILWLLGYALIKKKENYADN